MSTREIVTLQFGHYSNYVGTHWWNLQELGFNYDPTNTSISEINHDVLFREGLTAKGEITYTPRLLLVDLKGSLKSLPQDGNLVDPAKEPTEDEMLWDNNKIEVQKEGVIGKNKYQLSLADTSNKNKEASNVEEEIKVWSDFMYSRFHPRSINVIKEYDHDNNNVPFDVFPLGSNVWKNEAFQDNFSDNIRKYVEECDQFQGFHILLDATNAFAGLSTSCMQYLQDEYDTKSIFSVPILPSYYSDYDFTTDEGMQQSQLKDSIRVLNVALCFDALLENGDMFVPLSVGSTGWRQPGPKRDFGHLQYKHESLYQTSAILAAALDTFTLKHRLNTTHFTLSDMASGLTQHGRKLASASVCLPFAFNAGADLVQCLDNWDGPLTRSITPGYETVNDNVIQMITLRGITEKQLKKSIEKAGNQKDMPAYKCTNISELLSMYLAYSTDRSVNIVTNINKQLDVNVPFPQIFDKKINANGFIDASDRSENDRVSSVPIMAGLHSHSNLGKTIEALHTEVRRIKIARFHQFFSAGFEKDDYSECLDRLFDFRECYEDSYFI